MRICHEIFEHVTILTILVKMCWISAAICVVYLDSYYYLEKWLYGIFSFPRRFNTLEQTDNMLSIRKFVDFRKTIGCAMSVLASGLTSSGFARKKKNKLKRQQLDGTQVLVRAERWAPLSLMFSESDVEKLGKPQRNLRRKDANHRKWRAEKKKDKNELLSRSLFLRLLRISFQALARSKSCWRI